MTPTPGGSSLQLAMAAMNRGHWELAERLLRELLAYSPAQPKLWADLGFCLRRQRRLLDAEQVLRSAIDLYPNEADLVQVLGTVYLDGQRGEEAGAMFRRACVLQPSSAAAHYGLAIALQRDGRLRDAVAPAQIAADLEPNHLQYQLTAAVLVQWDSKPDAATSARKFVDRAATLQPRTAEQWQLLAKALWRLDDRERALAANREAVRVAPDSASAHWHLATALLRLGQWAEGWNEFEWRLHEFPHLRREFERPQWNGEPLTGRTILLHAEGGFGDALNFVRFLPQVQSRGGHVLLECQPALVSLMRRTFGAERVFARGEPLPPFDIHIPLQGLPRVLKVTPTNVPARVPYVAVDEDASRRWAQRLASLPSGPKVGIAWAGSFRVSEEADDRSRSLELFEVISRLPGVTLVSLQKGPDAEQAACASFSVVDWTNEIDDFDSLGALVNALDEVVTVDTSVAHLVGALGKPVRTLIPAAADFRWLLDQADMPWYPTMRLYRQSLGEDWARVLERLAVDVEIS